MTKKLLFFPPIILGVLVLVYMVGLRKPPEQEPPKERVRHVRIIEIEKLDLLPRTIGFGTVKPGRVWNAVAQVGGRVEYVHPDFKKGAIIQKGTEIVRIDDTDYKIAIKQAEANIRSAEARLKELEVTEQNNRNALKIEEKSLDIKHQELKRKEALLKKGSVAQASVDQERRDLLNQEKRVLDLNNSLKLLPTQRDVQSEQLAVYRTQLETAQLNLKRTSLRLPFTGRISEANVEVTQYVGVGNLLGAADGMEIAEIAAQIPIASVAKLLRSGDGKPLASFGGFRSFNEVINAFGLHAIVRLTTDDRKVEWQGEVARSSEAIDAKTRSAGMIVNVKGHYRQAIPAERPPLVKGMFVEVELRSKVIKGLVIVPRSAVHGGKVYVVNQDNRLEVRPVTVSTNQGNLSIVTKGLKEGEKIVVSDLSPVLPGMMLKLTEDSSLKKRISDEASGTGARR